jgi:hypothetical protein
MTEENKEQHALVIPVSENQGVFHIPFETVDRGAVFLDGLIDMLCKFAIAAKASENKVRLAFEGVRANLQKADCTANEVFYWQQNFKLLAKLEREKRNTVWAYILKNAYRPAYLRRDTVDYIVGNPPWLAYAFIQNRAYKQRVKDLTFEHGLLKKTDRNLFTRMDTSSLFFAHCQRDFLRPNGTIAFVMPKTTMLPAKQHLRFQRIGFTEILDLGKVAPLFNVRSCVLVRGKGPMTAQVPCTRYYADFKGERNLSLADAK